MVEKKGSDEVGNPVAKGKQVPDTPKAYKLRVLSGDPCTESQQA